MDYIVIVNFVYSDLNSIFILNVIMMKYRFLAKKGHKILEIEPSDFYKIFLRFWPFEPHLLISFFLIKNRVYIIFFLIFFKGKPINIINPEG